MDAISALRKGWSRSAFYWQALVVLFLVNLISGALLAVIPAAELLGPAHYTAIQEAASGVPAWMAIETFLNPGGNLGLETGANGRVLSFAMATGVLSILLALALLPAVSWLPGSFVSGGLLLTYLGASAGESGQPVNLNSAPLPNEGEVTVQPPEAERFNWKLFLGGCWRYWGAFLLFGVVQGLLSLAMFLPILVIFLIVILLFALSAVLLVPVFLLLLVVWTSFMELGQVYLVAGEKSGVGPALRSALRLLRRRFWPLSVYYLASLILLLTIQLVFHLGLFPRLPLAVWPLVLIVQQAFIVLRLWARAARLAGDVEFIKSY